MPSKPKTATVTATKAKAPRAKKVEQTPVVDQTPIEVVEETPGGTRVRRVVTADSLDSDFTELVNNLQAELETQKTAGNTVMVKYLRVLSRNLLALQRDSRRVNKKKRTVSPEAAKNSGFNKPVGLSSELCKFLGLASGTTMSRSDVTKALQSYIKTNGLQNDKDGRIIEPNKELAKLLSYKAKDCVDTTLDKKGNPKNPNGHLYYSVMQKLIQRHYSKLE